MGLVLLTKAIKHFASYESSSRFSGEVCLNPVLVETLQANGLQFTPIPGDGDCFFKQLLQISDNAQIIGS